MTEPYSFPRGDTKVVLGSRYKEGRATYLPTRMGVLNYCFLRVVKFVSFPVSSPLAI